jgi:Zn-dependent peptidase ImmA (M78 family)
MGRNTILQAIRRYRCYHTPVDLSWIHDHFDVRYNYMGPDAPGLALRIGHRRIIVVDPTLHPYQRRMVLAHEAAHHLLGHVVGDMVLACHLFPDLNKDTELKAQIGASMLLVPINVLIDRTLQGYSAAQVAHECEVPVELVEMRLQLGDFLHATRQRGSRRVVQFA